MLFNLRWNAHEIRSATAGREIARLHLSDRERELIADFCGPMTTAIQRYPTAGLNLPMSGWN